MPRADTYVSKFFPAGTPKAQVRLRVLTPLEATSLEQALLVDASDLYYSAWVSFADALRGVQCQCFSWAIVKLYYSTFYSLRSALALARVCTFHVGNSPFLVKALASQMPFSSTEKGTHKTVMKTFQTEHPGHDLVSQQIDVLDALDWLIEKREAVNYRNARFSEPNVLDEFNFVVAKGLRQVLSIYLGETKLHYVFDPDHAIIAYPLKALQVVGDQMLAAAISPSFSEEEQRFLRTHLADRSGSFAVLVREMRRLKVLNR